MSFTIANSVAEALTALANGARPVAGGSDLVVAARHGKTPLPDSIVAIDRLSELAGIAVEAGGPLTGGLRIGALVTHAVLMTNDLVARGYTALADASALVGSPATRNIATLGGNVMNASPAMDTGAPLLVLGAVIELTSTAGTRTVAVDDLWTGPGTTSASPGELCTALVLPLRPDRSGSAYVRLEYRRAMEIAVVGAAAAVMLAADGTLVRATIALTAVAPTIIALDGVDALEGMAVAEAVVTIAQLASEQASPISDVRASDRYRRHCVGVMAGRALEAAARRAGGESIAAPVNRAIGIGATG